MTDQTPSQPVQVRVYRWGGAWGPFKVKIPCGECTLTRDVIHDTIATELAGVPVDLVQQDWLSAWWQPLMKGGWHAPIVLVDGRLISQGRALNRGLLAQAVIEAHAARTKLTGTHVFGKSACPHCTRAKQRLTIEGTSFAYHDVVKDPRSLYEMLARVKLLVGPKTPITVPQIWLEGRYIGGADALDRLMELRAVATAG